MSCNLNLTISRQLTKLAIGLLESHLTETLAMAGRANLVTLVESLFRDEGPVLPATPQQFPQITGNRKESQPVKCSDIPADKVNMLQFLEHKAHCFKAGGLREYFNQWQALTSDPEILQMILGQPIEFARTPYQRVVPREKKILDLDEQHVIDTEIDKLLAKGAITPSSHEEGEYISPIFTRAKKDGSFRVILNLKCLNTHVQYHHFKMDSLNTVLQMVKSSCFMASIDLKDAYYSVPIATADQKYLKFLWRGKLYKYVCFSNGLAFCLRKFTKLLKPVYSHLRQLGYLAVSHIDDSYLQDDDYDDCERNVRDAVKLFDSLRFIVHPEKSFFVPKHIITFMGLV